ncbi:hypothetical protein CYMTET_51699 [Cymbomonas tetramitiformis]|uniref:Uncharacterized protein n=1 Tax=Cymbomonas tetramitiformis TaxID=36881 RepID=A0AAE0BKL5_9CHLO|nr:hypothetical protein CYMTET_51699 [Cymbomonas tetramitiformis]
MWSCRRRCMQSAITDERNAQPAAVWNGIALQTPKATVQRDMQPAAVWSGIALQTPKATVQRDMQPAAVWSGIALQAPKATVQRDMQPAATHQQEVADDDAVHDHGVVCQQPPPAVTLCSMEPLVSVVVTRRETITLSAARMTAI